MYVSRAMAQSERQRLGPAGDLGVPIAAQRLHRGARQRFVHAEQPLERLLVAEAAVGQHRQQAWQMLEDGAMEEEVGRDPALPAAGHGEQLALAEELADPGPGDAELLGDLRSGERVHRRPAYGEGRSTGEPSGREPVSAE